MHNKNPLWKNILLVVVAVVGFVYALPNLYSEDPAVQISAEAKIDPATLKKSVDTILQQSKLPYHAISTTDDGVLVRFNSTDMQLQARDLLKSGLGQGYTIALNLVAATPKWLTDLGAVPMKQGLDLRGGVHFLMEVDVDSVVARRYEGLMKEMSQELREEGIRYSGIRAYPDKGISIRFRQADLMDNGLSLLKSKFPSMLFTKAPETLTIFVAYSPNELNSVRQATIEQTMTILRNRVNELGVGEAVVQQQGATRVAIDLPGIQDAARAHQILGGTSTLQFYLVDDQNDPVIAKKTGVVPVSDKLYTTKEGYPILLKRQVVLTGDSITNATASFDQQSATPAVQVQLGGGGEALFTKITRDNIGKLMAIVFVETKSIEEKVGNETKRVVHQEERVISAPKIQSALGTSFQINGITDAKEAANLALLLRAGALPAVIYTVEERTVGPSLGKENIRRGLVSLEVGTGLILILMLVYYRFFGLVANIALFLNLILLAALLSLIGATLTLPGIAAFVLTVAMAVDANVLIYERIREELRQGVMPHVAIHAGYERAFSTIIDANVTTLIVGIVLFAIGTGPIRGFAVILSLGLLTSMLTSITYTRAIVNAYYGRKHVKKLSIGI